MVAPSLTDAFGRLSAEPNDLGGISREAGVWECTPGPSCWKLETSEFVHILSGRVTSTPDGGTPQELGPGDIAVFPRGWAGTWDVHETICKVYVLF